MTNILRRQLTLFIDKDDTVHIENIRSNYNPIQRKLINAHVTLCREDEIERLDAVLKNLSNLRCPILTIEFEQVKRFDNGKGVWLTAKDDCTMFHQLRKDILKGIDDNPRQLEPHITLMHPRNSTCTDSIFENIRKIEFPSVLSFRTISLIEQVNNGKWVTKNEFCLTPNK